MPVDPTGNAPSPNWVSNVADNPKAQQIDRFLTTNNIGMMKATPLQQEPKLPNATEVPLDPIYSFMTDIQIDNGAPYKIDYPKRTAFVNEKTQEFFLKVEETYDRADYKNKNFWFGPYQLT